MSETLRDDNTNPPVSETTTAIVPDQIATTEATDPDSEQPSVPDNRLEATQLLCAAYRKLIEELIGLVSSLNIDPKQRDSVNPALVSIVQAMTTIRETITNACPRNGELIVLNTNYSPEIMMAIAAASMHPDGFKTKKGRAAISEMLSIGELIQQLGTDIAELITNSATPLAYPTASAPKAGSKRTKKPRQTKTSIEADPELVEQFKVHIQTAVEMVNDLYGTKINLADAQKAADIPKATKAGITTNSRNALKWLIAANAAQTLDRKTLIAFMDQDKNAVAATAAWMALTKFNSGSAKSMIQSYWRDGFTDSGPDTSFAKFCQDMAEQGVSF